MRISETETAKNGAENSMDGASDPRSRRVKQGRGAGEHGRHSPGRWGLAQRRSIILAGLGLGATVGVLIAVLATSSCACGKTHSPRLQMSTWEAGHRAPGAAPAARASVLVGAPGPTVACTKTFDVGAALEEALLAASPGSVLCLNSGHWPDPELSGIAPSRHITVAAAPGQTVYMVGLTMAGPGAVGNLTFQGIHFTAGIRGIGPITGNVVFKYDTLRNIPNSYAFYFFGGGGGGPATQTGVSILYSQIDHVGQCLELVGGPGVESDFTFAHNVCGPGIGYGESRSFGAHYIQTDGVRSLTVDNNAFEGPPDRRTVTYGNHLNVLHVWGTSQNVDFSNNIIWHARALGEMVLLGDNSHPSLLDNIRLSNNLDVSDPACSAGSVCHSYSMYSLPVHGMVWTHNTIIGSVWGVGLGWVASCTSTCYESSRNMTGAFNIAAPSCGRSRDCNTDYAAFACGGRQCVVGHNVSADTSADSALGGPGNVVRWVPKFRTTAWTPTSGPPWKPPPQGYYQPVGLPFAAGYQGPIGP